MKKLIVIVLLVTSIQAFSQDLANISGTFVDIGFGARPMGLGGAYTAIANDAYATLWNPAGLANLQGQYASFFYTKQFDLIPYTLALYAKGFEDKNWSHSEGLLVSGDDALRETVLFFAFGYSMDQFVDGLSLGATIKYKNATFGNNQDGGEGQVRGSAVGFGLDLGMLYTLSPKMTLGASMKNIFDFVSWNSSARGMYTQGSPFRFIGGIALYPRANLLFGIDFEKSFHTDTHDRLHFGMERRIFNIISLRTGAYQDMVASAPMNYHFGFGAQYTSSNNMTFLFDAAYLVQEISNSIRFSFSVRF